MRRNSSAFFARPACIISHATVPTRARSIAACGSSVIAFLRCLPARMGMRVEIQLPTPPIGYVRIQLCCRKVGMTEHLLHAPEIRATLEQVRRKRVPEQVRVDAVRLEPCFLGQAAEDEEGARPGQRAALGVEEQLRPVAAVEMGTAPREVAP